MAQVAVKADFKEVKRLVRGLSFKPRQNAIRRAVNTAIDRTYTTTVKEMSDKTGLKQNYIRRKSRKMKAGPGQSTGSIVAFGRDALSLAEWATPGELKRLSTRKGRRRKKEQRGGLFHKAWKRPKVTKNVFVTKGKNSGKLVAVRWEKGRQKITTVYGPVVWREFPEVVEQEAKTIGQAALIKELRRQVARARARR